MFAQDVAKFLDRSNMVYIFLFLIMLVIDQYTKYIVNSNFSVGDSVAIIENFFHLSYVENRGIAFGLFQGRINVVTVIACFVIAFICYHLFKYFKKISIIEKLAYIMILAGASGNMIDRIFRGYVIDMLDFRGIWSFVFNFADVWIDIGILFLILNEIYSFIKNRRNKKKEL